MDNSYRTTRIKLSALYFLIILVIVIFFSSVIIQNQDDQFSRLGKIQEFRKGSSILISPISTPKFSDAIDQAKQNLLIRVIEADVFIILVSIFLSYYIAGETLQPIEASLERQKKFIADASHELKTPLTSIITEAEVLLKSDRTVDQYKEFTKSVLEEGKRLSELTIQLLNIAKLDEQKTKLSINNFNINDVIRNEIRKFESLAVKKSVNSHFSPSEDIILNSDKNKVIQLIDIFLDNAIKYNKENGKVEILTSTTKDKVILSIEDTGIGISQVDLDKVFDRFYRASTDRHFKGFGLGLSIAQKLLNELKGNIKVYSTLNIGTKIIVSLKQNIK